MFPQIKFIVFMFHFLAGGLIISLTKSVTRSDLNPKESFAFCFGAIISSAVCALITCLNFSKNSCLYKVELERSPDYCSFPINYVADSLIFGVALWGVLSRIESSHAGIIILHILTIWLYCLYAITLVFILLWSICSKYCTRCAVQITNAKQTTELPQWQPIGDV